MGFIGLPPSLTVTVSGGVVKVVTPVTLAEGTVVGLTTGTEVRLATGSTVALAEGTQVKLATGSTVALAGGTEVRLATGSTVALATGTQVKLSTGSVVALESGTVVGAAGNFPVTNPTGQVLQTGNAIDYIGTMAGATRSGNLAHKTFTGLLKSYAAIMAVVYNPSPAYRPACLRTRVTTATWTAEFISAFGPIATSRYEAICGFGNEAGQALEVLLYYVGGTAPTPTAFIYGLTDCPVPQRSDGRAYPLGTLSAWVTTATAGTHVVIGAPTSPLRPHIKSVQYAGAATAHASVYATKNGTSTVLVQTLGGCGTHAPEGGILCDPGTAVKFTVFTARPSWVAILYDLIV